jgi:hypothetical protein
MTLPALAANGQCTPGGPPNPPAIKRAMVGVVMDTSHRLLEGVDVAIRSPRRQGRTDRYGRFQLADLDTGTYELTVRRIGYAVAIQWYHVTDSGGVARFCLISEPRGLAPMITSARRGGLSGVVGDSVYKPVAGAEVRVVGAGQHTLTDSAGGFHLPLNRGTYPVVVTKDGYGKQLLSVTIPPDSGREIAVWLGAPQRNPHRFAQALDDMRTRILLSTPNRSGFMSAEALAKLSTTLAGAALVAARTGVKDDCVAIIDGGAYRLPLYMIDKDEVAFMEVYLNGAPRQNASVNQSGTAGGRVIGLPNRRGGPPIASRDCGATIYVWMKP